jgi:hypothetical protein
VVVPLTADGQLPGHRLAQAARVAGELRSLGYQQ